MLFQLVETADIKCPEQSRHASSEATQPWGSCQLEYVLRLQPWGAAVQGILRPG